MRTTLSEHHYPIQNNKVKDKDKEKLIDRLKYAIEGHPDVSFSIFSILRDRYELKL